MPPMWTGDVFVVDLSFTPRAGAPRRRLTVLATALVSVALLAGCGLPRSGPNKNEIFQGAVERGGNTHIIYVNDHVARAASFAPSYGFGSDFTSAGSVGADEIRPGDVLGLTIWENVDDGLLASLGQSNTNLQQLQVDSAGYIFVPYAGRVKAAGNSPDRLRQIITSRLEQQTPDPQVTVTRVAGDGATVSVMGKVGGQGVFPIERPTRTLSAMLAKAGGAAAMICHAAFPEHAAACRAAQPSLRSVVSIGPSDFGDDYDALVAQHDGEKPAAPAPATTGAAGAAAGAGPDPDEVITLQDVLDNVTAATATLPGLLAALWTGREVLLAA